MSLAVKTREMVIRTDWQTTEPNPDEEVLREEIGAKLKLRDTYFKEEMMMEQQREQDIAVLLRAGGLDYEEMPRMIADSKLASRRSLEEVAPLLMQPIKDVQTLHEKDMQQVKANLKLLKGLKTKPMSGFLFDPIYGGAWKSWNGETEEIPAATTDTATNKVDLRTQAFGEGWWDADYSEVHGYLAFRFTPPTWGQLHVYAYPWLHGFYNLYADDTWYKSEKAEAKISTWVDVHQNFWRTRNYATRFHMTGSELHPTRYGRMDHQYAHGFHTPVGEGDPVTIRVGVRLFSYGKASGGRSTLDFHAGNANYVKIPYLYWRIEH
jgi:hypothetical protein